MTQEQDCPPTLVRCDEIEAKIEAMLERAAATGAKIALANVGLSGDTAAGDVQELRGLLDAFRLARRTAWTTAVGVLTAAFLAVLLIGAAVRLKTMGGGIG